MSSKKIKRKTRYRKGSRRPSTQRGQTQDNPFPAELDELRAILDRTKEHPMRASERDKLLAFIERLELVDNEIASPNGTTEKLRELVSTSMFEDLPSARKHEEEDEP